MAGYIVKQKPAIFKDIAQRQAGYKQVFGTDMGKMVLDDLLLECSIARTAFSGKGNEQTHVNLGKQLIGYHLMNLLNIQLQEIE